MENKDKILFIYLKAIARALIMSTMLLLIISLVFFLTDMGEAAMESAIWVITIVSICYSGIYISLKVKKRGFLHGGATGILYILIVFVIAYLTESGEINIRSYVTMFSMALIVGALSGMIGSVLQNKE